MNPLAYLEHDHETLSVLRDYPGWKTHQNSAGWTNHFLGDHLAYSHRKNHYTPSSFPEKLHTHEHYELLIPLSGDITLIVNDYFFTPAPGSVFLFEPGTLHTARLLSESDYDRHALFFTPEAFHLFETISFPLDQLASGFGVLNVPIKSRPFFYALLSKLDHALDENSPDCALLAYSYIIQLFSLLTHHSETTFHSAKQIPGNVLKIKQYIDENFLELHTITQIADHFFYRREYISRLFKAYFNLSLSDYLSALKIRYSKELLQAGVSVTDACYQSGFRNMSTFINTFRRHTGVNPSEYR